MRETAFPQIDKNIVADDGDAFTFCSTCAFSRACLSQGMDKASLRDLHMLGWLALRSFGVRDLEALVGLGHLGPDEAIALERERRVLCRLRYGLHLVAARREERLRFDYQKLLAERLGYADDGDSLAVEKMMQGFYRSAAIVRRVNDRLLQRFEEHFDGSTVAEPINADFDGQGDRALTRNL